MGEHDDRWADLARRLAVMGPPQVPGPAVAGAMARQAGPGRPRLILGLTPALTALPGPLVAVEGSAGAFAALWPGDRPGRRSVLADWRALPVPAGHFGAVLGDGALNVQTDPAAAVAVLAEAARVLAPFGSIVIRVFLRPTPAPLPSAVLAAAAGVGSLNVLRWQLASALAAPPGHAVAVADILTTAEAALGPLAAFARAQGLDAGQVAHWEAYRGSPLRYLFPDAAALSAWAAQAGLSLRLEPTAGYPGAADCPLAVFAPA